MLWKINMFNRWIVEVFMGHGFHIHVNLLGVYDIVVEFHGFIQLKLWIESQTSKLSQKLGLNQPKPRVRWQASGIYSKCQQWWLSVVAYRSSCIPGKSTLPIYFAILYRTQETQWPLFWKFGLIESWVNHPKLFPLQFKVRHTFQRSV